MESLIFAFGAVAPIIFTVGLGYILKKIGLLPLSLTKPLNKLVFRVLLGLKGAIKHFCHYSAGGKIELTKTLKCKRGRGK